MSHGFSDAAASLPKAAPVATRPSVDTPAPAKPVHPTWDDNEIAASAMDWLAPWIEGQYPGRIRLVLSALGRSITYAATAHWRKGRRRMPAWAATALANAIEARCRAGLEIVEKLERHATMERMRQRARVPGYMIVKDDGQNRRANYRR